MGVRIPSPAPTRRGALRLSATVVGVLAGPCGPRADIPAWPDLRKDMRTRRQRAPTSARSRPLRGIATGRLRTVYAVARLHQRVPSTRIWPSGRAAGCQPAHTGSTPVILSTSRRAGLATRRTPIERVRKLPGSIPGRSISPRLAKTVRRRSAEPAIAGSIPEPWSNGVIIANGKQPALQTGNAGSTPADSTTFRRGRSSTRTCSVCRACMGARTAGRDAGSTPAVSTSSVP